MNKKIIISYGAWRFLLQAGFVLFAAGMAFGAAPRSGEAVVAARVGKVQARVYVDTVHYGETEVIDLEEGSSIGANSRVMTGKGGRTCMVLSPGAVLCIAPQSELEFSELRHSADGLPETEDDLIRRIRIHLKKGRILIHAAAPTPSMDIQVRVDAGVVDANGGTFAVAQTDDGEWALISEEFPQSATPAQGVRSEIPEGTSFRLTLSDEGLGVLEEDSSLLDSPLRKFEVCECYFDDLETFIRDPGGFDRSGLSQYIGTKEGITIVGTDETVTDVSPFTRTVVKNEKRLVSPVGENRPSERWTPDRTWAWYENMGVVKGVNYIPRNAVNSTEMWMEDSFDPGVMDEELGWAQDAGYTTLRVQLQYAVWKDDPEGFMDRLNQFVDLAEDHKMQVVPVLFDDRNFAEKAPSVGPQPDPIPGEHNARWTPSPGAEVVQDRSQWPDLQEYVTTILEEFKRDDRIAYWDLYNRSGDNELWEKTLPLMDQTFDWAREVDPKQPLAVAAWTRPESAMSTRMLENSDVITFQSFESADQVEALLLLLKRYDRPIICSDWLMRQRGNRFEEILPLFSVNRVGWFNRGLVNGKTQEWIQQDQYRSETDPDLWQQDVFTAEGEPYDDEEIKLIQEFRFQDRF
jgi:hypothetical protein